VVPFNRHPVVRRGSLYRHRGYQGSQDLDVGGCMINISKGRYWDLPWSLVDGCTPCSPGCDHCWSAGMAHRFYRQHLTTCDGKFNGHVAVRPERLHIPLRRRKPTVYAVWNDLFHEDVQYKFVDQALSVASLSPQHTFLILTKRPLVMTDFYRVYQQKYGPPPTNPFPNVYHGLTVCNQAEADEKIPIFLQVPGKKFLSIEPMLGAVSLRWISAWNGMATKPREWGQTTDQYDGLRLIDAVILGGETGPGARPMQPDWVRYVRDQCAAAGVPFFFKQWGKWGLNWMNDDNGKIEGSEWMDKGIKKPGRLLDGRTHDDLPWREHDADSTCL
jgi:protein gp37